MTSVSISIFPEFIDKIERLGLTNMFEITKNEIINKQTGSKIIFKGIKTGSGTQTANLKSIANVDTLVVDESEEIPTEEIFDKIDLSIRCKDKHNKIILIFNPMTKAHWIYNKFYLKNGLVQATNTVINDVTFIHTTYKDNKKNLSPSYLEQIKQIEKNNPNKYNHIILGAFLDNAEGTIFTNWKIGEFIECDVVGYGADFGFSVDPTALVKVSIDKKNKIIYIKEELYQNKLNTTQLVEKFKSICGKSIIYADYGGGGDRIIDDMSSAGLNIRKAVKGKIIAGITLIQDYQIIIDPSSTNAIKEFQNYIWKDETPIDCYNHICDGLRYFVTNVIKVGSPIQIF